jgi:hypothetical protein
MTQQLIRRIILPGLLAIAASLGASAAGGGRASDLGVNPFPAVSNSSRESAGETQNKGRFKKQGDACVWDANDSGPNQCTPTARARGRFKGTGDNCVWHANDRGPDQCRPKTGRFKKDGDKCVWNASDSGPDQCKPK